MKKWENLSALNGLLNLFVGFIHNGVLTFNLMHINNESIFPRLDIS